MPVRLCVLICRDASPKSRLSVALASIGLLVLGGSLGACSGGGGSTPTPTQPITVSPPPPPPPPPPPTNLDDETNVIYGTGLSQTGSTNLLLDIYQPSGDCIDPRPFVVGIHGGGFANGSKSQNSWVTIMEAVTERGLVGMSIDYRLVGDLPVVSAEFQPLLDDMLAAADSSGAALDRDVLNAAASAFEDTVTALDWARENAQERCLDMDRFAVWGSSAGAITALHVGHGLDEYFIDSPDPTVIIDYWGRMFLDGQLDGDGPPLMIIHGTNDETVDYDNAVALAEQATAIGLPHSFYTISGGPHGFASILGDSRRINGEAPLDVTLDFVEDHLRGNAPLYETLTVGAAAPAGGAQNTDGANGLFIGNSFFVPVAGSFNANVGRGEFPDHRFDSVFSGGATGMPAALWQSAVDREDIEQKLAVGDIDVFGMTIGPIDSNNPTEAYERWIDLALSYNPDTSFFIGFPYLRNGPDKAAEIFESEITEGGDTFYPIVQTLRESYPDTDITFVNYGLVLSHMMSDFEAGSLEGLIGLVDDNGASVRGQGYVFEDRDPGHAGPMAEHIAGLVWANALYGADIEPLVDPQYRSEDVQRIADKVIVYNRRYLP